MTKRTQALIARAHKEKGKWLATATGGFYFLNGQNPKDITLVDVAIGLARKCRYSGNITLNEEHYSVAEHSDLMVKEFMRNPIPYIGDRQVRLEDYLKVKLHDATEFVFPDVPTPIKDLFPVFREVEGYHDEKIESAFIPNPESVQIEKKQVKVLDIAIRTDERRKMIAQPAYGAGLSDSTHPGLGVNIRCLEWREAAYEFIEDYIWAVENIPAHDPENQSVAIEHMLAAKAFLAENPKPPSRQDLRDEIENLKAQLAEARQDNFDAAP